MKKKSLSLLAAGLSSLLLLSACSSAGSTPAQTPASAGSTPAAPAEKVTITFE